MMREACSATRPRQIWMRYDQICSSEKCFRCCARSLHTPHRPLSLAAQADKGAPRGIDSPSTEGRKHLIVWRIQLASLFAQEIPVEPGLNGIQRMRPQLSAPCRSHVGTSARAPGPPGEEQQRVAVGALLT
jgi:hypothetical protein